MCECLGMNLDCITESRGCIYLSLVWGNLADLQSSVLNRFRAAFLVFLLNFFKYGFDLMLTMRKIKHLSNEVLFFKNHLSRKFYIRLELYLPEDF